MLLLLCLFFADYVINLTWHQLCSHYAQHKYDDSMLHGYNNHDHVTAKHDYATRKLSMVYHLLCAVHKTGSSITGGDKSTCTGVLVGIYHRRDLCRGLG